MRSATGATAANFEEGEPFPQPKRASLAEGIADSVAEAIATGRLGPGERLVETALAKRLDVSRVSIREALKVLHTQGILIGGGHRGYRVAAFGPETSEKVVEIRLMLETFLLRDAILNWRTRQARPHELDTVIERMRMAARAGDFNEVLIADLDFHRAIAHASGNATALALWTAIARHVLIIFNLARFRDADLHVVVRRHEALRDFILSQIKKPGSPEQLHQALDTHFMARRKRGTGAP